MCAKTHERFAPHGTRHVCQSSALRPQSLRQFASERVTVVYDWIARRLHIVVTVRCARRALVLRRRVKAAWRRAAGGEGDEGSGMRRGE